MEILLHLAFQKQCQFSAVKIFAELWEGICVKLIVIGAYNGIIDMNCENDLVQCCIGPLHIPYTVLARNVWLESSRLQLVTSLVQTVVQDTIPQRWAPRQMHAWNARQTLTRQQLVMSARTVFATLGQLGLMVVYVPSVLRANTRLILAMLHAQPALQVSIPHPLEPHPMYARSVRRTPMPLKQVTNKVTALATLDTRARMGVFVRNV